MAEYIRDEQEVRRVDHDFSEPNSVRETGPRADAQGTAARAIWYVAGVLLAVLGLRFILALLGANPANAFASFIYSISYPFVAPFVGLFNYGSHYGAGHFETYTLMAMIVYLLVAWGIARLITLNRPAPSAY